MRALVVGSLTAALALILGCAGGRVTSSPVPTEGPTQLAATATFGEIAFTWTPPVAAFDGYEFEGRSQDGSFVKLNTGLLPNTWTTARLELDPNDPECAEQAFRLRVVRGGIPSLYSNEVSCRNGIRPPSVHSPYPAAGGIQIRWENYSLVADSLLLERGETLDGGTTYAWTALAGVPATATSWIDTGPFVEGAAYGYRVTYGKGEDKAQAVSSYPLTLTMLPPADLSSTSLEGGVRLSWKNQSQIAEEIVVLRAEWADPPSFQEIAYLPSTATTYEDLALPAGQYTYRVEARKAGISPAASAWVQTTALPPGSGGL